MTGHLNLSSFYIQRQSQNKKICVLFFLHQIIYHEFAKVNASDLRKTGTRNSTGLSLYYFSKIKLKINISLVRNFY